MSFGLSIGLVVLGGFVLLFLAGLGLLVVEYLQRTELTRQFRALHSPAGRLLVFVYSDSPNWRSYIDENILPHIAPYALVLNWSQRNTWPKSSAPLEVRIFRHWSGDQEFNPLAILIPPKGEVETIRFGKHSATRSTGSPFR